MEKTSRVFRVVAVIGMTVLSIIYLVPMALILMNSFKSKVYIDTSPFSLPTGESFAGWSNYADGLGRSDFVGAVGWSFFITIASTVVIVLVTSMTAWYIARVKSKLTSTLYYLFVFSMIVPFQMVMFTMSKVANMTRLDNPFGIVVLYTGFGAGLSVFIFVGFIRSIPIEIEEAAMVDGASPWQVFFKVIFPVLRPTAITVAILNAMWIWNDYLLPFLVIGSNYQTIPIAVQKYMTGSYGAKDLGGLMAMLVIAIIPIIAFYLIGQRHIIKGVISGAVKG
ncbi:MAG: carbohydrate ABC transporter permease [Micrococcales bacterium]|nr:carbohydrate ABC transporter permease [Micrococcales bacterium]